MLNISNHCWVKASLANKRSLVLEGIVASGLPLKRILHFVEPGHLSMLE